MGLLQILVFSALTGVSFGFAFHVGETSVTSMSFLLFDLVSKSLEPSLQAFIGIISIIFSIYFIFRLAKVLREIYQYRLAGIGTTFFGFAGSFLSILGTLDNRNVMVAGILILMTGVFLAIFYKKKEYANKKA